MEQNKAIIKTLVRFWKSEEMISLYVVLGVIALVFGFVALQNPFYYGILLAMLFFIIVGNLIGKFTRLARLSLEEKFKTEERDTIIRFLEDGIVIYDPNFRVLTFNNAAEKIFGLSAEEVVEKQFDPGMAKTSRYRIFVQTLFPSLAPSITPISETDKWPQIIGLSFENPKLELRVTLHQIKNEEGGLVGFVKMIHDTTREKGLLQAKSDFIGVAAHQLRTPLTGLHWAVENILKLAENNPEIKSVAQEALVVAERSLKITNDLLDVSKIEEGKFGYSFKPTDLSQFIETTTKETKPLASQYGISVEFSPSPTPLPEVFIDESRLSAVLLNLIDNAIRYNTKNGRVVVSLAKEASGNFARISVADTGIGISKDDIKNLFQKLYRGSNAAQVEPNGSGLGLYIAKNIIKRHGGVMGVESELNRGSTFWFTIPLDKSLVPQTEATTNPF